MNHRTGSFVVSLDFELNWGAWSEVSLERNRRRLLGVWEAIPKLLDLFTEYEIHATWATVGFLFCETREELLSYQPHDLPRYPEGKNPYEFARHIGKTELEDPFHFAPSLVALIASASHQEIGSHTFSHMFCLEEGATREALAADLRAAAEVALKFRLRPRSLVFPKNQINSDYLSACGPNGLHCYRDARAGWIYTPRDDRRNRIPIRALRLLDAYLPFTDGETSDPYAEATLRPVALGASRFLRPWSRAAAGLEPLRLRRITRGLDEAAECRTTYHLWWHPHNFGLNLDRNLDFLRRILDHVARLRQQGRMASLNMAELVEAVAPRRPVAVQPPAREAVAS